MPIVDLHIRNSILWKSCSVVRSQAYYGNSIRYRCAKVVSGWHAYLCVRYATIDDLFMERVYVKRTWTRPESKWALDHWRAFVDLYTLLANSRCGLPSPWVANCSKNAPFEHASTTHHHHHSFTTMFASVNLIFHSTIFSTCYPQVPSSSSTLLHVNTECFKLMT